MIALEIDAPADALALARSLVGRPGLAVLHGVERFSFVACDPIDASNAWIPDPGPLARGWGGHPAAPRWIGAIPYEAGRGLERPSWTPPETRPAPPLEHPRWLRYDAVARVDRVTGRVAIEADDSLAADRLARALRGRPAPRGPVALRHGPVEPDEAHVERVREVLRLIARGDVYQVNLARCLELRASGEPLDIFDALFENAPSRYGLLLDFGDLCICGTSPELALEVRGDVLRTCPIKGTRSRGRDASSDAAVALALDADAKERAELTMAIDLHRNDLGRVAVAGSVRVLGTPRVIAGRTVWSREAEIVARRAPGARLEEVVRAVVPCGSVTGAPKVRAMEIIRRLEAFRRGLYTGVYGYIGRDGGLVLAMAIRTLELMRGGVARYATGGGIVADSDPIRELEETRWKAQQVTTLLPREPALTAVTKVGRKDDDGIALEAC